ncbi:MAG: hypothetical protein A2Y91_05115 [Chloroflexi bacterium RBG_13_54_8]|nr:MAG: hypothetical protein A2Y91_05115 [Chloroflexi bacterium RBG_13_54_8]
MALGVKRVAIVTNYNDADTEKLRAMLKEAFKDIRGLAEWKVLNSDMTAFAKFLDDESERIGDALNTKFKHRITKQLAEHTNGEST